MYGITSMMEAMLFSLAKYKYLTVSHILALGISKSKDMSRKYFLKLMKEKLVDRQIHSSVSENAKKKWFLQRTRHEYLWYLTRKWALFLESNTELNFLEIRFPKRPSQRLKNDYFHRVSTIFINISFEKWLEKTGGKESQFLVYYDNRKQSVKRNFEAETRLELGIKKHYTPDIICGFRDANSYLKIFCLEVYNGDKVGYVEQQLIQLFWILDSTKKIEQRIDMDAVPRILVTFDNEQLYLKVLSRIQQNNRFHVEGIEHLIFFNSDVNVWKKFGAGWVNVFWEKVDLELIEILNEPELIL